jgi:phosphoglycolate phosphatase-like HAD superfamily hydrolase
MTVHGMIFDIDGTLVDTNPAHVIAWQRAFSRFGFEVPVDRIELEIGKGGDKLVPSVLGDEVEDRLGETLRKAQKEEFLIIARSEHFRLFPGVPEVFRGLRERGVRTALATSSDEKHLEATLASAGLDLTRFVDIVVTKSDAEESKPAPDIVVAAVDKLGLANTQCPMVGDTIYDGQACRAAGIAFLGVLSGGTSETELLEAGAIAVWRDVGHLFHDLDRALEIATQTGASAR